MMQQPNYSMEKLTTKGFPKQYSTSHHKSPLNFFDSDLTQNPVKTIWRHPSGKVLLIVAGSYAFLYAGGFLLRAGAYFMGGWHAFKDSICPPDSSSSIADKH